MFQVISKYVSEYSITEDSIEPDRRWMHDHGIFVTGEMGETVGTVVFIKDTSGSIDSSVLSECVGHIQRAAEEIRANRIVVIDADCEVRSVEEYGLYDTIPIEAKGRGGTDFQPALQYVDDNIEETRLIIYFTDGWGSFPKSPPRTPVLWISYGASESLFPFGEVIKLSDIHN